MKPRKYNDHDISPSNFKGVYFTLEVDVFFQVLRIKKLF